MHGEGGGGETGTNDDVLREAFENVGATIMGRNMFGGGTGPWSDEPWDGWWGDNPPYHTPVFVLTHHPREPLVMQGGTTFFFVTDGIESALKQAREAAGGKDVALGGGAKAAQQYLAAGLIDEMEIHLVPLLLGGGERLFDNLGGSDVKVEARPRDRGARRHSPQVSRSQVDGAGLTEERNVKCYEVAIGPLHQANR